jgi:hypothetical protein
MYNKIDNTVIMDHIYKFTIMYKDRISKLYFFKFKNHIFINVDDVLLFLSMHFLIFEK